MVAFNLRNCDENPYGPRDIKQLRLVNRVFSIIGAEFLLPEIHLTFQNQSFGRLKTISEHPTFSQHVQRLHYEPDSFGEQLMTYSTWLKSSLETPIIRSVVLPDGLREDEGQRTEYVHHREQNEFKIEEAAGRRRLSKAYELYKEVYSDQMQIRQQQDPYYADMVAQAIARLPKLVGVTLSFAHGVVPHSAAFMRAYAETFHLPEGDDGHRSPYGVTQLCSVLLGVASAGTKLSSLDCGQVDWKFLKTDERHMDKFKLAVKHLEYFRILFSTSYHLHQGLSSGFHLDDPGHISFEPERCNNFLQNYRVCELVSAAKYLKALSLAFDEPEATELKYVVGTTTWASLRFIQLTEICAAEDTLIEFLERHAGTLKKLGLNNILLLEGHGDWTSLLPRIRKAVKLDELCAVGNWWADDPYQHWEIDTCWHNLESMEFLRDPPCKLGMAVKKYMLNGGNCPLLDLDNYPMYSTIQ